MSGGEGQVAGQRMRSVAACPQLIGQVAVEVREGLEETFGVAQAHPGEAGRILGQRAQPLRQDRCAAVKVLHPQVMGVLVLATRGSPCRRTPGCAGRGCGPVAAMLAQSRAGTPPDKVRPAWRGRRPAVRGRRYAGSPSRGGFEPGDVAEQVVGVGAQIPDDAGEAGDVRVGAPPGLIVAESSTGSRPSRRRVRRRRRGSRRARRCVPIGPRAGPSRTRSSNAEPRGPRPLTRRSRTSSAAVSESRVRAFPHTTEMPASRNVRAISKWLSLGVATTRRPRRPSRRPRVRPSAGSRNTCGPPAPRGPARCGSRSAGLARTPRRPGRIGRPGAWRGGGSCRCPRRRRRPPFPRPGPNGVAAPQPSFLQLIGTIWDRSQ